MRFTWTPTGVPAWRNTPSDTPTHDPAVAEGRSAQKDTPIPGGLSPWADKCPGNLCSRGMPGARTHRVPQGFVTGRTSALVGSAPGGCPARGRTGSHRVSYQDAPAPWLEGSCRSVLLGHPWRPEILLMVDHRQQRLLPAPAHHPDSPQPLPPEGAPRFGKVHGRPGHNQDQWRSITPIS